MASPPPRIDRQTTTPFLLKLFYRTGNFHRNDEFLPQLGTPAPPHLQIYTWPTCSLRELTHLLVMALPTVLPSPAIGTRLAFRLIYPDTIRNQPGPAKLISKELGSVVVSTELDTRSAEAPLGDLGADAEKTLQDAKFVIGDYVSCAIYPPLANGDIAGPPPPQAPGYGGGYGGRGGRPPPRENGFGRGRDFRPRDGELPVGEWRRGDVPPPAPAGYGGRRGGGREFGGGRDQGGGRDFGGGGFGGGYGRGRGRGRGAY